MSKTSRILIAVASFSLLSTLFLPTWQIDLTAPQYPEGLSMQIWLDKITGQVEIINGLNHYIGMKHIKAEMFPEFGYLTYILIAFVVLGLLVSIIGKRPFLFVYICLLVAGGAVAMVDFYQWGYDYGHNLDPAAAIQVPGLSYQPPLIGYKQLLNFEAGSFPAAGGWIVVLAGIVFIAVWWIEWFRRDKKVATTISGIHKRSLVAAAIVSLVVLAGCETKPEPFAYGKEGCHFCKMTIMEPGFGGELVTKKGKLYKFDDLHCLIGYLKTDEVKREDLALTLVIDHTNANKFLEVTDASFILAGNLHSPMNSNAAAFASADAAAEANKTINGGIVNWETLYTKIR